MRQIVLLVFALIYLAYELDTAFLQGQYTKEVKWYVFRLV